MRFPRVSLGVVILLACTAAWLGEREVATQSSTTAYSVTDVGTLGGATSVASGVGGFGSLIAGTSPTSGGQLHAFAREFMRPPRDLGTLGGGTSEAFGVNADGYFVVGKAQLASGASHAVRWAYQEKRDLGTLGGAESDARGVNDHGIVVGASRTATGTLQAFIWTEEAGMRALGASLGGPDSRALGINNAGKVVGWAQLPTKVAHAFLFAGGVTTDLTPSAGNAAARAINELDQVVGYWQDGATTRAFLSWNGAFQSLPALTGGHTSAYDINDAGVIVGESAVSGVARATIWRNGQVADLNQLIPSGSGWVLNSARSIDDAGHIVGVGTHGGRMRAFLLVPPADLQLSLSRHENEIDTNHPNPHEAGRATDLGVTVSTTSDKWITGIVITDTLTGPWQYEWWDSTVADCTREGQTLTCRLKEGLEPGGRGRDLMIRARSTGAGTVTHSATARADQSDPNPSNNSATESNVAVSLASLTLASSSVVGGGAVLGRTTLTSPAPWGDARVTLTSSNPAVASVPYPFDVQRWCCDGGMWREFYVRTQPVTSPTTVRISAMYGLVTRTQDLTILPSGGAASSPWGGTPRALPGRIQAEYFDTGGEGVSYHDTTVDNLGGQYRTTRVDIERTADTAGGLYNIGWIATGEWLKYTVNVGSAGTYAFQARVAVNAPGGTFHVESNGVNLTGPMTMPNTGGWQRYVTITSRDFSLPAGQQVLRVVFDTPGSTGVFGNLNWIEVVAR